MDLPPGVRVLSITRGDALEVTATPYGNVGRILNDEAFEALWVSKAGEDVDPHWFSQPAIDLLVVIQGDLKFEFADTGREIVLHPGDAIVLPPNTRCRAYRWPRDSETPAIFLAVYPAPSSTS